jgi:hypothetical protein
MSKIRVKGKIIEVTYLQTSTWTKPFSSLLPSILQDCLSYYILISTPSDSTVWCLYRFTDAIDRKSYNFLNLPGLTAQKHYSYHNIDALLKMQTKFKPTENELDFGVFNLTEETNEEFKRLSRSFNFPNESIIENQADSFKLLIPSIINKAKRKKIKFDTQDVPQDFSSEIQDELLKSLKNYSKLEEEVAMQAQKLKEVEEKTITGLDLLTTTVQRLENTILSGRIANGQSVEILASKVSSNNAISTLTREGSKSVFDFSKFSQSATSFITQEGNKETSKLNSIFERKEEKSQQLYSQDTLNQMHNSMECNLLGLEEMIKKHAKEIFVKEFRPKMTLQYKKSTDEFYELKSTMSNLDKDTQELKEAILFLKTTMTKQFCELNSIGPTLLEEVKNLKLYLQNLNTTVIQTDDDTKKVKENLYTIIRTLTNMDENRVTKDEANALKKFVELQTIKSSELKNVIFQVANKTVFNPSALSVVSNEVIQQIFKLNFEEEEQENSTETSLSAEGKLCFRYKINGDYYESFQSFKKRLNSKMYTGLKNELQQHGGEIELLMIRRSMAMKKFINTLVALSTNSSNLKLLPKTLQENKLVRILLNTPANPALDALEKKYQRGGYNSAKVLDIVSKETSKLFWYTMDDVFIQMVTWIEYYSDIWKDNKLSAVVLYPGLSLTEIAGFFTHDETKIKEHALTLTKELKLNEVHYIVGESKASITMYFVPLCLNAKEKLCTLSDSDQGVHWVLMAIRVNNITNQFEIFDCNSWQGISKLSRNSEKFYTKKMNKLLIEEQNLYSKHDPQMLFVHVKQTNSSDCGVFIVYYLIQIMLCMLSPSTDLNKLDRCVCVTNSTACPLHHYAGYRQLFDFNFMDFVKKFKNVLG